MYFIMIISATVMFSFQFLLNDGFRREQGSSWNSSLKFSLYTALSGLTVLLIINKMNVEVSLFSLLVACVYSVVCIALSYASIKAFMYANLSVYSVFLMIGGMILPFLYGIMCGEEFKAIRLVCCVLIALSVTMSIKKGEHSKKATKYYILIFVLNGLVGVLSKFHQSYTGLCVDSGSFMILVKIISALLCLFLLLLQKERTFSVSKKSLMNCGLYSILNSIGNLLLLISLLHLPASVQYPVVTGGSIILSTIITTINKEEITKKEFVAAGVAFIASVLMAI